MKRESTELPVPDMAFFAAQARAAAAAGQTLSAMAADRLGVSGEAALEACAKACGLRHLDSEALARLAPDFSALPFAVAERRAMVLARETTGAAGETGETGDAPARTWLVLDDPFDQARVDWAEHHLAMPYAMALATREAIHAWLKRFEATQWASEGALTTAASVAVQGHGDGDAATVLSIGAIAAEASPVVRLVSSVLFDALKAGASDLHLETDASGMAIKVRVDGVLDGSGRIESLAMATQVVSRIKVLADLDIAEQRVPQDGRFQVRVDGRDIDLRVSIMPAVHGEDAVIRILDRQRLAADMSGLTFETLGFDAPTIAHLRRLASLPYGLMLVTGPTGSGKTTTLYAALTEINRGDEKIVTIEDPVEYQLSGVVQVPVNEKRGLTFSRGLRSILRHDPDKIMVGEIRDSETGQIAVQAALTGHLVLTTVHANSVFDVIGRMLHIGVDPFNLVSALNGIVAQRLVRMTCTHCAEPVRPDLNSRTVTERQGLMGAALRAGRGCTHCRGTGYRGRRAVAEILELDDELRDLISQRASIAAVKQAARRRGMRSIRGAALALVREGLTTLDELDRVTFADPEPV